MSRQKARGEVRGAERERWRVGSAAGMMIESWGLVQQRESETGAETQRQRRESRDPNADIRIRQSQGQTDRDIQIRTETYRGTRRHICTARWIQTCREIARALQGQRNSMCEHVRAGGEGI